jgi:histidine ammonia-lyase
MCGAQGIDFRAPLKPGVGVGRAHEAVRVLVPRLERDRVLSRDIETLAHAIKERRFDPDDANTQARHA